ncbi:MAG: hypothetical protein LKJ29_05325 [Lactobacillus sp.]|jgi:uncharacterized membrane protein YczE|nr:hypothetical protein [Lactobacillus sp.]MCI1917971.1 hypothetical protein [Lactobacillus sp.]MCI1941454.1 hypothetical protein [Lactobacillus sp.]MCI1972035.1 hypothetical protein [Lactobacillus sp.]MCI2016122.1 hypothetical protein [Lactobacillus sp.]
MKAKNDAPLRSRQLIGYFVFSILLNGFGNGLTVAMNLGSALWTASAVNLAHALHLTLLTVLLAEGVAVVLFNALVLRRLEWRRIAGNCIFMIPFSFLVSWFAQLIGMTPLVALPLMWRVVLDLFGIVCTGVAVSIYQRLNVMLHPNDDLMQILRFHFLHGNAALAQPLSFVPPITLILICVLATRQAYALNIGTLFSLVAQGAIVGLADRVVFPQLKHRHLVV